MKKKISISKLKCFKSCRRMYELKYIEGLQPVKKIDALETGINYHNILERMYNDGEMPSEVAEPTKEYAMAVAYEKYIYPNFNVEVSEQWVIHPINDEYELIGRVDGLSYDNCLVEHKTTSADITEAYEYNLLWDEQILAYMLATGTRKVYYTVCRKPTIRQKKDETDEEFFKRMIDWYDEDTDSKIRLLEIERTDEEVEEFKHSLEQMCGELDRAQYYYRNTNYCNCWGRRCEYSSVCLHYDKDAEYIEFTKVKKED